MPDQNPSPNITTVETNNITTGSNTQLTTGNKPHQNKKVLMTFTVLLLILIVFMSMFLVGILHFDKEQTELLMGLLIVTSIVALMTLLYITAAGFSFMGLTDSTKALGLPEGSIRAMIALILIMVFIIFGIYTFKSSASVELTLYENLDSAGLKAINLSTYKNGSIRVQESGKDKNNFDVIYSTKPSEESSRLAQQLLTTVGTLVVSIASFYFGSATVNSAITTARSTNPSTSTTVTTPNTTITTSNNQPAPQGNQQSGGEDEGADPIGEESQEGDIEEPPVDNRTPTV